MIQDERAKILASMLSTDLMLMLKDCSNFLDDKEWKDVILNELKTRQE